MRQTLNVLLQVHLLQAIPHFQVIVLVVWIKVQPVKSAYMHFTRTITDHLTFNSLTQNVDVLKKYTYFINT